MRFDLTGIAPGTIRGARLELTAFRTLEAGQQIRVYGLEHDAAGFDWTEAGISFASAPGLAFDGTSGTIASGRHFQTVVAVGLVGVLAACRGGRRAGR